MVLSEKVVTASMLEAMICRMRSTESAPIVAESPDGR